MHHPDKSQKFYLDLWINLEWPYCKMKHIPLHVSFGQLCLPGNSLSSVFLSIHIPFPINSGLASSIIVIPPCTAHH